ncbi:MAG TPA: helix-turn-helix domain-containing protein [Bryobacteraceae bacterium]|nr:helix-turn-helix domain-containing protein [Bryobacteraceae bacterium]
MHRKTSRGDQEISNPRQIRVLASPVRQDILDTVDAAGPCSVAQLARLLGMRADGLYYHIRCLSQAGLLKVASAKNKRGRREARLEVGRYQWIKYRPSSAANRNAVVRVAGAMLRNARRQFARAFHPDIAAISGPKRNLWAARARAFLSPDDLKRLNILLAELLDLFDPSARPPDSGALHEITFVIAPVRK